MAEKSDHIRTRLKRYLWFVAAALPIVILLYFWYGYPNQRLGPKQPIYFSHRVHTGVKQIDCRFCHPFPERSENAGIPVIQKCFFCHEYIIKRHPQILKEREHYDTKTPVPWVRVFYLPDHVQFTHVPHVKWEKIDCTECHGDVQTMDRLPAVDFKMQFCITCHQERQAQLDCWLACHH